MSSITEGLCSPLASRVESVLHMNENPIDLYGVASSLKFYLQIVIKVSPYYFPNDNNNKSLV